MNRLVIKPGLELTTKEILEVDEAKNREWENLPMSRHNIETSIFFYLRDEQGTYLP